MYLNIMIIALLIHSIGYYLSKNKNHVILSCGLFSFISDRATGAQKFSWDKFNHLGLDNDERGGDSIGRVVGNNVCKFVSKRAKTTYQEYVINHKNGDPYHIALGHTRKASVGTISEETAQPIILDLPDGGKFTMVHNGTLFNWEELATKYGIEKHSKTDSMILAEIIMTYGFDVLLEYQGAAALIIKDDREPDTIKVFKGLSKTYANKLEEERPLYYYQESANSMYLSSREEGLYFIGGDVETVLEFDSNVLYTILAGQVISTTTYDRSECSQVKVWPVTTPKTYGRGNNFNTKYNAYSDDDYENSIANYYESKYSVKKESSNLDIKKDLIINPKNPNQIVCARLRYWFHMDNITPTFANGVINLDENGIRNSGNIVDGEKAYYFYRGIMLKDKEAYDDAKLIFGRARQFIDSDSNIERLAKYTEYPICTLDCLMPIYQNTRRYIQSSNSYGEKAPWFYGSVNLLWSAKVYTFSSGSLNSIRFNTLITKPTHKVAVPAEAKVISMVPVVIGFNKPKTISEEHAVNCTCVKCYNDIRKVFKDDEDYATEDVSYNIKDPIDEDIDYEDVSDDALGDSITNSMLNKAIDDGLQAVLMALDLSRAEIEISGFSSKEAEMAINNFLKLEDVLLEAKKFKTYSLVTDYERF